MNSYSKDLAESLTINTLVGLGVHVGSECNLTNADFSLGSLLWDILSQLRNG